MPSLKTFHGLIQRRPESEVESIPFKTRLHKVILVDLYQISRVFCLDSEGDVYSQSEEPPSCQAFPSIEIPQPMEADLFWLFTSSIECQRESPFEPEEADDALISKPTVGGRGKADPNRVLASVDTGAIQALSQRYSFVNRDEVLTFLDRQAFLVDVLIAAGFRLKAFFPNAQLTLEFAIDPEEAEVEQIAVVISTALDATVAWQALQRFKQEWWLDVAPLTEGKICLYLDFK